MKWIYTDGIKKTRDKPVVKLVKWKYVEGKEIWQWDKIVLKLLIFFQTKIKESWGNLLDSENY